MSTDRSDPSMELTVPFSLTKTIHRQVPDSLQPEKHENRQDGKIVVITGGGTGIGAAAAHVWLRARASGVVIAGRRKDKLDETIHKLEEVKATLGSTTKLLAVPTDLKVEADVLNLFQEVNKTFGRPADVVIANAGASSDLVRLSEDTIANWWSILEINVLGMHNTFVAWVKSQPDPKNPVGTIINVNSGMAGKMFPGVSSYSISKLATHRYMEFVDLEYPTVRSFTLLPGIVATDMSQKGDFSIFAKDEAELTGCLALFLASDRANYLRGSLTSVNWDLEEMEAHKNDIENGLLKIKWIPVLPVSGGTGI